MTAVGDTLWRFDINRRVYPRDKKGHQTGPIYSEHFESHKIGSETPQSWLITDGYGVVKVNKKTMKSSSRNGWGYHWFTDDDREDAIWLHENKHHIINIIQNADSSLLRTVAAAIGYQAKDRAP